MEIKNQKIQRDQKIISEDLSILESQIEGLWQFLPIPICFANSVFSIINASKALEDILGCKGVEAIGENLKNVLKDFERIKRELMQQRLIISKETTLLIKNKKEIIVELSAKTKEDEKREIMGYFFAFIDMTEVKEKEKELQRKV